MESGKLITYIINILYFVHVDEVFERDNILYFVFCILYIYTC